MANEQMQMSNTGLAALRNREGAILRYYNDSANNCTYGVGTLAHHGVCSAEELQRPVTIAEVNARLATRVGSAAATVRRHVRNRQLTQAQFDALVSFTFNTGAAGARATLDAADQGVDARVVRHINSNVYVHPRDARGQRLPSVRVHGLVVRRREEAAPFLATQGAVP